MTLIFRDLKYVLNSTLRVTDKVQVYEVAWEKSFNMTKAAIVARTQDRGTWEIDSKCKTMEDDGLRSEQSIDV